MTTPEPCGCRVIDHDPYEVLTIDYCPTHAAAFEMAKKYLDSLERVVESIETLTRELREDLEAERAAIAKARGTEEEHAPRYNPGPGYNDNPATGER